MIPTLIGGIGSPAFSNPRFMANVGQSWLVSALLVPPMVLVVVSGGLDLSVGAVIGFVTILAANMMESQDTGGAFLALVVGLLVAFGIGLMNGLLTGLTKLHGAVITLGMMTLLRGAALNIGNGSPIFVRDTDLFSGLTIPAVVLLIILIVVILFMAEFTKFGRKRFTESMEDESWLGRLIRIVVPYTLSGTMAGLAAFLLMARLGAAMPTTGTGVETETILAVLLAGIPLGGGLINIIGAMLASLLIALDKNVSILNQIKDGSPFVIQIKLGLELIIFGVLNQTYFRVADWFYKSRIGSKEDQ
jgi:ribose transport system permease protein